MNVTLQQKPKKKKNQMWDAGYLESCVGENNTSDRK